MMNWMQSLKDIHNQQIDYVVLSVVETKGSTPCRTGDKVIFTGHSPMFGSIGGGNLEYQALNHAGNLLTQKTNNITIQKYPLGATLGQCCGGYVKVLFENFVDQNSKLTTKGTWLETVTSLNEKQADFVVATIINSETEKYPSGEKSVYSENQNGFTFDDAELTKKLCDGADNLLTAIDNTSITEYLTTAGALVEVCYEKFSNSQLQVVAVFGAGHISQALMPILIKLPVRIYWIDDRKTQFEEYLGDIGDISLICDDFVGVIDDLPKNIYSLVITYSHRLDYDICEKILTRDSFSYLGVIGSTIKGNKFRDRLRHKGWPEKKVNELICPIGAKHKFFKSPGAIAVSLAMDLLNFLEQKKQSEIL